MKYTTLLNVVNKLGNIQRICYIQFTDTFQEANGLCMPIARLNSCSRRSHLRNLR